MPFRKSKSTSINVATQVNLGHPQALGLVGMWNLSEGVGLISYDKSARGYKGTLTNGPTWNVNSPRITQTGNPSNLSFDGTNDYVGIPAPDAPFLGSLTIIAWVKITTGSIFNEIAMKCLSSGGTANPFEFRTTNDATPKLVLVRANTGFYIWTGPAVSLNVWHHVAVTTNSNLIENTPNFYVDGVLTVGTTTAPDHTGTGAVTGSSNDIWLGRRTDGLVQLAGNLNEVRIYNRALSSQEIWSLYQNTLAIYFPSRRRIINSGAILASGAPLMMMLMNPR